MGLYLSIPHQVSLKIFKEDFEKRNLKKIPTEDLVKMPEFVLNNNIFEFNIQRKLGRATGTDTA